MNPFPDDDHQLRLPAVEVVLAVADVESVKNVCFLGIIRIIIE